MITITIDEDVETRMGMVDLLNHIATMVKDGFTSGINPTWELLGEEEKVIDADIPCNNPRRCGDECKGACYNAGGADEGEVEH